MYSLNVLVVRCTDNNDLVRLIVLHIVYYHYKTLLSFFIIEIIYYH